MAGHTFDDLAKALATGASRRSVLKAFGVGLLGALAGATLGPRSAGAAETKCDAAHSFTCSSSQNQPTKTTCTGREKVNGGPKPACTCFKRAQPQGAPECGNRTCFCEDLKPCHSGTDAECLAIMGSPNYFCATQTCCGGSTNNVCIPLCGQPCPPSSGSGGLTPVGPVPLP
jgi:hypothetical protein